MKCFTILPWETKMIRAYFTLFSSAFFTNRKMYSQDLPKLARAIGEARRIINPISFLIFWGGEENQKKHYVVPWVKNNCTFYKASFVLKKTEDGWSLFFTNSACRWYRLFLAGEIFEVTHGFSAFCSTNTFDCFPINFRSNFDWLVNSSVSCFTNYVRKETYLV